MEILKTTLLKWNFEEVNDILSNLRTCDDPNIQPSQAVLPSTEKIISKARKITLDHEELQLLKKEYEETQALNIQMRKIRALPQILEEDDIYEEMNKIQGKIKSIFYANHLFIAHSALDEDEEDFNENEETKFYEEKHQRPNSAALIDERLRTNLNQHDPFWLNHEPNTIRWREAKSTMYVKVGRNKNPTKGFSRSFMKNKDNFDSSKLPPIFDNQEQKEINLGILK